MAVERLDDPTLLAIVAALDRVAPPDRAVLERAALPRWELRRRRLAVRDGLIRQPATSSRSGTQRARRGGSALTGPPGGAGSSASRNCPTASPVGIGCCMLSWPPIAAGHWTGAGSSTSGYRGVQRSRAGSVHTVHAVDRRRPGADGVIATSSSRAIKSAVIKFRWQCATRPPTWPPAPAPGCSRQARSAAPRV
jgi:hypothetical protein